MTSQHDRNVDKYSILKYYFGNVYAFANNRLWRHDVFWPSIRLSIHPAVVHCLSINICFAYVVEGFQLNLPQIIV